MTDLDSEAREPMRRVSSMNPCTVCAKPDWCGISADGHVAVCMRTENGTLTKNGGWLHQLAEPIPRTPARKSRVVFRKNWTAEAEKFAANLDPERKRKFVASLSLPPDALDVLPLVGYFPDDTAGPCFTFTEVNAAGTIIGISRRWKKGGGPGGHDKMMIAGGHRGLTLPNGWRERTGPVFVVEGPTDTAAMTAAGLSCVGRPGANMGAELLAELFRELPPDRDIIIVGENDEKPDGKWPGRTGAIAVAGRLAELLHRPVRWSLTPGGEKDPREWFAAQVAGAGESVDWLQFGETSRSRSRRVPLSSHRLRVSRIVGIPGTPSRGNQLRSVVGDHQARCPKCPRCQLSLSTFSPRRSRITGRRAPTVCTSRPITSRCQRCHCLALRLDVPAQLR